MLFQLLSERWAESWGLIASNDYHLVSRVPGETWPIVPGHLTFWGQWWLLLNWSFRNAAHSFMGECSLLSTRSSFTLGFSSCLLGWKVISPSVSPLIQSYYKSTDLSVCETETCCLNSGQIQEIIFSVVVLLTQSAQQEIVVSGIL